MGPRVELLNKHLQNLIALNQHLDYEEEIRDTVNEINKELGVGSETALSSYSTVELHEELLKRENVSEIAVSLVDEAILTITTGNVDRLTYSYPGPARILINRD